MPWAHEDTARRLLLRLADEGYVEKQRVHTGYAAKRKVPPRDHGYWWWLTKRGQAELAAVLGAEVRTVGMRGLRVMSHDRMVVDTIVLLIEAGRQQGLAGVWVERESLLAGRRPMADAVVVLRMSDRVDPTVGGVPWTAAPALPWETSLRDAVEADNNTELDNDIVEKAMRYRAALGEWKAQDGAFPQILWVTPMAEQRDRIHGLWVQAWRSGSWLLATIDEMQQGTWWQYAQGTVQAEPRVRVAGHMGTGAARTRPLGHSSQRWFDQWSLDGHLPAPVPRRHPSRCRNGNGVGQGCPTPFLAD